MVKWILRGEVIKWTSIEFVNKFASMQMHYKVVKLNSILYKCSHRKDMDYFNVFRTFFINKINF